MGYIIQLLPVKHINYLRGKELKFQEGKNQAHSNRPIWDILPNKFFIWLFLSFCKRLEQVQYILFVKFIYSEKATKFCEISILDLTVRSTVKSKVEILQNLVAFSEYLKNSTTIDTTLI